MAMNDDEFLKALVDTKVTDKSNPWFRAGTGRAIIKEYRVFDAERSGKCAVLDFYILSAKKRSDKVAPNDPGTLVSYMWQFETGKPDRQSAVLADFKRALCGIMGEDVKTIGSRFGELLKAANDTKLAGVPIMFDARDAGYETKDGEPVYYPTFVGIPVEKAKLQDFKAKVLAGEPVEAFVF